MARSPILEGTWEELKLHDHELRGKRFRLVPVAPLLSISKPETVKSVPDGSETKVVKPRKLMGRGMLADLGLTTEEYMRNKHEEIALEERNFNK